METHGNIGQRAELAVLRKTANGLILQAGGVLDEVLLPNKECPRTWQQGDKLDVFLHLDSEDRPIATLRHPKVMPGEFACLEVLQRTQIGSFLDWGLAKDLFLPFREQNGRVEPGKSYVIYAYVDEKTGRIVASHRIGRHLAKGKPDYQNGAEVQLLIYAQTDLGYKAIINGEHGGLLFANEVFKPLKEGDEVKGYIKNIRDDGKIDLSLNPPGRARIDSLEAVIEGELRRNGGFIPFHDKSPADEISRHFGVSKKAFKQATGALFRQRKITFEPNGIRAV
ncbi:MAG: CvfB family protein [Akkermansiaceae bacterium]